MTHNGHQTADPVRVAAEDLAGQIWTRLGYPQKQHGYSLLVDEIAALLRRSGAVVQVDDDSPFCRPRVSWPRPAQPTGIGPVIVGLWCGAASFAGYVLAKWVA